MFPLIPDDFVNREPQLEALVEIIRQETEQQAAAGPARGHRLLLITGPKGIGKTYLLAEYKAHCEAEGIDYVWLDLAGSADRPYLQIALSIWPQLDPEGFEPLRQVLNEAPSLGAEQVSTQPPTAREAQAALKPALAGGRGGGIDFHGSTIVHGDVVARDAYYIQQIIRRDDPIIEQAIETRITAALRECLVAYTKGNQVIFLCDTWDQAVTEMRRWLLNNLLNWILAGDLPQGFGVLAGTEEPDFGRARRYIRALRLDPLQDEAVETYWIEKLALPDEDVADIIKYSGGNPLLMAMLADQRTIALEHSG